MTNFISLAASLTFYFGVAFMARWSVHGMAPTLPLGSIWFWYFGTVLLAAFYNTMKGSTTGASEK